DHPARQGEPAELGRHRRTFRSVSGKSAVSGKTASGEPRRLRGGPFCGGSAVTRRQQVVYLAAAWCLSYPDEELIGRVPLMRAALAEFPGAAADFAEVLDLLESTPPMQLQAHYVREF